MSTTITTVNVAAGNLFKLAAQIYGDATQWNRLAEANGMTDFIVPGPVRLLVPPPDQGTANGGILGV
jgi:nucleoid-associated protein YgaU